jgi:hypothetical protein
MRSNLLALAIAAGLGFTSLAASAQDATPVHTRHHKKAVSHATTQSSSASTNAEVEALKAQLQALQSQVAELEARTNAQSDINVSTGQAVESVQKAQVVSDTKVSTIDKLVNNTSVSGKMFFDFSSVNQKNSDTGKTNASGVGLDVKRFYLGVDHKFNDIWSANLTTDFSYIAADSETNLFVKKAYVQAKFDQAAVFRIGSADMPWIPFVENYYGYRYVENTLTDRLKYANSADWGLHLGGDIGASKSLNYAVSVVNGGGYKNPSRSKVVDVEGRVGFVPFEGMVVAVGGYSGKRGQETETTSSSNTAQRGDVLVAYASKSFRIGGEYFTAKDWNNVLTPLDDKANGYSFWGSVAVADKVSLFARYDSAKLSTELDRNAKDTYYNAGVQYDVTKGFQLALVYKHEKGDKSVNTPIPPHVQNVKTDEVGVFGQVAF